MALAYMSYIINLGTCEVHPGDGNTFNDFITECYNFRLYMIGVHYYLEVYLYIYVNNYIWMKIS